MHAFTELIDGSTSSTLAKLRGEQEGLHEALQTSGATNLVKSLQMIQLQKAIMAVGMFSLFESMLQDSLKCKDGFTRARQILEAEKETKLGQRFSHFTAAINVLKHGRGRSYDALVNEVDELPFRIRRPGESFFNEGDISEGYTLVEVDDAFVLGCAEVIREVSGVVLRSHPGRPPLEDRLDPPR